MGDGQKQFRTSSWFSVASVRRNEHGGTSRIRHFLQPSNRRKRPHATVAQFAIPLAANVGTISSNGPAECGGCIFGNSLRGCAGNRSQFPHGLRRRVEFWIAARGRLESCSRRVVSRITGTQTSRELERQPGSSRAGF